MVRWTLFVYLAAFRSKIFVIIFCLMNCPLIISDPFYHSSFIGFTMYKASDQSYSSGDKIIFDGPLYNEDNGYDTTLNAFICPETGVYFASVTFKKVNTDSLNLDIVVESAEYGTKFRSQEIYTGNEYNTVSNGGLFFCLSEQEVWVAASGTGSVLGDPSRAYTTFTIMKIGHYNI